MIVDCHVNVWEDRHCTEMFREQFMVADAACLSILNGAKVDHGASPVVVKHCERSLLSIGLLPKKRAEYHRPFEALAFVDGQDFDGIVVALQAEFVRFATGLVLNLRGDPAEHGVDSKLKFTGGGVDQLSKMQEIR